MVKRSQCVYKIINIIVISFIEEKFGYLYFREESCFYDKIYVLGVINMVSLSFMSRESIELRVLILGFFQGKIVVKFYYEVILRLQWLFFKVGSQVYFDWLLNQIVLIIWFLFFSFLFYKIQIIESGINF